ncbi:hypothetical protein MRS44_013620 [Fusarium solani]|uniref:uncharacterized protein n=1 Tax=Fusarium solani TaxID=169388 RepID=UPI0032C49CEE|nr:hypothetical protein MRS44_013620 [Fusarium solani]
MQRGPCASGSPGEPQVALFAFFLPDSTFFAPIAVFGNTGTSIATALTRTPIDEQSVRTKSPSLVKDSEVSQDLAKLTSTTNDPSPLPSTYTVTVTLPTTGSLDDYAIEDDGESLEEFKDNADTHEPKLEAFPRIKPTCARPISLIGKLIRNNTPHDTGSGDGSEKTRTSGNTTEQGPRIFLSQVEDAARKAKEND